MQIKPLITLEFIPCHRLPARSLHIHGKPFLCYRCLAILLGYGAIPFLFLTSRNTSYTTWVVGILLQLPMLIDGTTQYHKWRTSNNLLRVMTGLMSGIGQSMLVVFLTHMLVNVLLEWS